MKRVFLTSLLCLLSVVITSGCATNGATEVVAARRQDTAPAQTDAREAPLVAIENWTKPQPGWLYVLDPRPNVGETGGHVWLLDPENGEVMGSIRTGYHPDFALSPDGAHLYIASDAHVHSTLLAVVDTSSGEILAGETIEDRAVPTIIPAFSTTAVSGDGKYLRILVKTPDSDEFRLDTIDTESGVLLPNHVSLGHCGDGQFVSFPTADQLDFVCPTMKKVRLVRTGEKSKELDNSYGEFPWNHKLGVADAFPTRDGKYITVVRGDGAVFGMDVVTLSFYPTAARGSADEQVFPSAWPRSPDGTKVYLGYHRSSNTISANATAHELRIYDTSTWHHIGTIKTSMPFWSATIGDDGERLYAMVPEQHCILVIDTATKSEIRTITVGAMPALALVAP